MTGRRSPGIKRTEIEFPTFHADQVRCFEYLRPFKRQAVRCGRRWGKTVYGEVSAASPAIKHHHRIGWFVPEYKVLSEAYSEMLDMLGETVVASSKNEGIIKVIGGGRIEFWTLENERAGRSRKYHGVIIDEGAFTKPNMMAVWERSIEPTLLDYRGWALVLSNTNGIKNDNFFWQICNEEKWGFKQYHAPSSANPYMPLEGPGGLLDLKSKKHPLVWQQEYLAEFVDFGGVAFFSSDKLLVNGQPVPLPTLCDSVFCTIDTALKPNEENDGSGVTYFAVVKSFSDALGYQLVVLDYDLIQIEGAMLEVWLPTVISNLEMYARRCRAVYGSKGAFIEDKASGIILLQQAANKGIHATAIDNKLTELGKDARAINVSGYVYQGLCKIAETAYEKVITYKETTRNHWLSQIVGFRIGVKDQQDDLLDTFTYGLAIALGNPDGY